MRKETLPARKSFARTFLSKLLNDAFARWRSPRSEPAPESVREPARRGFALEALEPRLLLSADISYGLAAGHDLTLKAGGTSGAATLDLYDGASLVSSHAFDLNVTIERGGFNPIGDAARAAAGDTLHIDLSNFSILDAQAAGGLLDIKFTGGSQTATQDLVQLDGSESIGFGLKIESDTAISVPDPTQLTATGKDISLMVSASDDGLPPDLISPNKFYANANHASVSVLGDLTGEDITLSALAGIDVDNASLSLGPLQLAFIYATTSAHVDVGGRPMRAPTRRWRASSSPATRWRASQATPRST
jgi:hypothetical protein